MGNFWDNATKEFGKKRVKRLVINYMANMRMI